MSLANLINNEDVQLAIFDNDIVLEGTVATTGGKYNIRCDIRNKERDIPHFHIMTPDRKVDFCIKLGIAEWFVHGNHIYPPTETKQVNEIIKLLSNPFKKNPSITNYEYMVYKWNEANYAKIDESLPMPDYSTLDLKDAREMIKYVNKHGGARFTGDY